MASRRVLLWFAWMLLAYTESNVSGQSIERVLIPFGSEWRYRKGTSRPPGGDLAWRGRDYLDSQWASGRMPFRYGDGVGGTVLNDMRNRYSTLYLRRNFSLRNVDEIGNPELLIDYDDGFIVWINGREVARSGVGNNIAFNAFATSGHESGASESFRLDEAASFLFDGSNVIAIQVFNVNLTSSDLMMNVEFRYEAPDREAPKVVRFLPEEGSLERLSEVSVKFSEPVDNVTADDLLINGDPALSVFGEGADYVFQVEPPSEGAVIVSFATLNDIQDLARPANRLNSDERGTSWRYQIADDLPPEILSIAPSPGALTRSVGRIAIHFNEPVQGVARDSLTVNGESALAVAGFGAGPYWFELPAMEDGIRQIAWSNNHVITDLADTPNRLSAEGWSFLVDSQFDYGGVRINEFLASNQSGMSDEDGAMEDWIELYNPGQAVVRLGGWALTDDPATPGKWVLPDVALAPNGYLLVYASGKNRRDADSELHANFKLSVVGEYLGLFSADSPRQLVSQVGAVYPEQRNDHSYGVDGDGRLAYFSRPTPGAANLPSRIEGILNPPHFSVGRGIYDRHQDVILSSTDAKVTIRYTLDGSTPSEEHGLVYEQPIRLTKTGVIRAGAFREGYLPSRIMSHSYFYRFNEALSSLPILSLSTDKDNLWGSTGIQETRPRNTVNRGMAWERPVSAEYIDPSTGQSFAVDCGLRIQGGNYVRGRYDPRGGLPFNKYSFRLYFRGDYGPGRLEFPLIPNSEVASFDTLVLRAGMNDHSNPFIVDELVRRLQFKMGHVASRGTFVNLFMNGRYLGYYNPTERVDEDFMNSWATEESGWDVIAQGGEVRSGTKTYWTRMLTQALRGDLARATDYNRLSASLDLVNFADYILLNAYVGTGDWPHNNWRAARPHVPGGKFRFIIWDAEWALGNASRSVTVNTFTQELARNAEISDLWQKLRLSEEFRLLFADRVHAHMFGDGALTTQSATEEFRNLRRLMSKQIGGMRSLDRAWFGPRRNILFGHLKAQGLYRSDEAPQVQEERDQNSLNAKSVTLAAVDGTVFYTLDGSDPRMAFSNEPNPDARVAGGGQRIAINTDGRLQARTLSSRGDWSAMTVAEPELRRPRSRLKISEIMYNPIGGRAFEYVELTNTTERRIELTGARLEGIGFEFVPGTSIGPKETFVLASDLDPDGFAVRFPHVSVVGYFGGSLANGGERLALVDGDGAILESVDYRDDEGWPVEADGGGASLERVDLWGDPDEAMNWVPSVLPGGTPGFLLGAVPERVIEISEIFTSGESEGGNETLQADFIELVNISSERVDISGWTLTDDGNTPAKYVIPSNTSLDSGQRMTFWAGLGETDPLGLGFGLSQAGEAVFLFDTVGARRDGVRFGQQLSERSLGRINGRWELCLPTPNAVNQVASSASVSALRINEWMAFPDPGEDDWIELYNRDQTLPVDLREVFFESRDVRYGLSDLGFVSPGGFVRLWADEEAGLGHLDFKLSSLGERIRMVDKEGAIVEEVTYGVQSQGVSEGRPIDGGEGVVRFQLHPSPGESNVFKQHESPLISEVLARAKNPESDWVELGNPLETPVDLSGMSLSIDRASSGQWTFPPGTVLGPGAFVVVWCEGDREVSFIPGEFNTGRSINGQSGSVYLFDRDGVTVDALELGPQIVDMSVARIDGRWQLASQTTLGRVNSEAVALGASADLKINEWLADPIDGDDWFEIFNAGEGPVDMGGMLLTDDPSIDGRFKFMIPPLTFIEPRGFVTFIADADRAAGRNHVAFSLNAEGESLELYANERVRLDGVTFGLQKAGISQGLLPDGSDTIGPLAALTPGLSNSLDLSLVDSDGDGLSDLWENLNGLDSRDASDAETDADGDGATNREEFVAGTDPQDRLSRFALSYERDNEGWRLEFTTRPGLRYLLQRSDDLGGNWIDQDVFGGDELERRQSVPIFLPNAGQVYFRLSAFPVGGRE